MAKKTKAFSKIFKAGEGRKSLLTEEDVDDTINEDDPEKSDTDTFEDDFPLEPSGARDPEDHVFGQRSEGDAGFLESNAFDDAAFGGAFEGEGSNNKHSESGEASGEFKAFEEDDDSKDRSEEAGDDDGEFEIDDAVVDAAFEASFSGLDAAFTATEDADTQEDPGAKTAKGKRRITKLFRRKDGKPKEEDVPVARCGEIVVDKSKIPAKKCDMVMIDGKLVAVGGDKKLEDEEDKAKKGKFNALKNTVGNLKKKVTSGLKDRMDESSKDFNDDQDEDGKEHSEENHHEEEGAGKESEMPKSRSRGSRRRRSLTSGDGGESRRSATSGDGESRRSATSGDGDGHRRRRRDSRMEHQKGSQSNRNSAIDSSRRRRGSEEGEPKQRRSRAGSDAARHAEEDVKIRRSRTSNTESGGGTGGGSRRRHTMLEKHSGAQNSPHRGSGKQKVDGNSSMDGSERQSSRRKGIDESHSRRSDLGESSAGKRGSRRRDNEMEESSKRNTNELADGSSTRRPGRRDLGARRESRRHLSVRKTLSGDGPKPADPLSSSDHHAFRRANTDSLVAAKFQRAQSTRNFGKSDLMSGGGLTGRERLRRATLQAESEGKTEKVVSSKQTLGALYGGGNRENSKSEEQDSPNIKANNDGGVQKTLDKGEEDRKNEDENLAKPDVIVEGSEEEDDESEDEGDKKLYIPSDKLSSKDIDKLVKVVARRAKDTTDDNLESFIMDSLHNSTSLQAIIDEDDGDESDSDDSFQAEKIKNGGARLSRRDLQQRTRSYVNVFLASSGNLGESTRVANMVASQLGKEKAPGGQEASTSRIASHVTAQLEKIPGDSNRSEASRLDGSKSSASEKQPSAMLSDFSGAVAKIASEPVEVESEDRRQSAKAERKSSTKSSSRNVSWERSAQRGEAVRAAKVSENRSSKSDRRHKDDNQDPSAKMSWERSAKRSTKVELAKARAAEKESAKKVDFSEVTSKLEARKEAKAKARVKNQMVAAK